MFFSATHERYTLTVIRVSAGAGEEAKMEAQPDEAIPAEEEDAGDDEADRLFEVSKSF